MTTSDTQKFADDVVGRSYVTGVGVDGDRHPPLVIVDVAREEVPPGIHDLIDEYQATIADVETIPDGLRLSISVPNRWKDAGSRNVRVHGSSLVLTLTPEALDAANIAAEEKVDLHARHGEVHIKKHDDGPRFP